MSVIYILEDDAILAAALARLVQAHAHEGVPFGTPDAFLQACFSAKPDAVLLDWMLPRLSGLLVLRELRRRYGASLPIVMLTALGPAASVADAVASGVDSYIVKPGSPPQLLLTIDWLLRPPDATPRWQRGPYTVDTGRSSVELDDRDLALSPGEFALAQCLFERPCRLRSNAELASRSGLSEGLGSTPGVVADSLTPAIARLREVLGLAQHGARLLSLQGCAYRLEPPTDWLGLPRAPGAGG
jgi:DNA-binding response OmpR family regulator